MLMVLVKFPRRTNKENEVAAQLAEGKGFEPAIN
jgi:hypothetical protein